MKKTLGDMSVLENNPKRVVLIAPPYSRRVKAFQQALQEIRWPLANVISFQDVVDHPARLTEHIQQGDIVRLETSGECLDTERLLLRLGASKIELHSVTDINSLQLEQGEIIPSNQWYAGLTVFFKNIKKSLEQAPPPTTALLIQRKD